MTLTDLGIRQLPFQPSGQKDYPDTLPGLALRVGKQTKTFMLLLGSGRHRKRLKLGQYPYLSLADARSRAKTLIGEHQSRKADPSLVPFKEAYERFMTAYEAKNRASTVKDMDSYLTRFLMPKLENKAVQHLSRALVVQILDNIEKPAVAHHFFTSAHTFFQWCKRYGISNPLDGVEKPPKSKPRTRLITNAEFVKIWRASLLCSTYGRLIRFLFTTGQRRSQGAYLHDSWIDRGEKIITFPPQFMKTRVEMVLPYGNLTAQQLSNEPGLQFPTAAGKQLGDWGARKDRLDEHLTIPPYTVHDIRRFYSSTHSAIKTPPHIRELLLAHTIGSAVSRTYDRYGYLEEKREAQLAYETYLSKLLEGL